MKLYRFILETNIFDNDKELAIRKIEYDAEEKPKTYIFKQKDFPYYAQRISKENIGKRDGNSVFLLEDDFEKAKEILTVYIEKMINHFENTLNDTKRALERANIMLKQLPHLKEEENDYER